MSVTLGIAVLSSTGDAGLRPRIEKIQALTTGQCRIIVAADAPSSADRAWCQERNVAVVGGPSHGFAWNVNRALWSLLHEGCAGVVLLCEGTWPVEQGWDEGWRAAISAFGLVCATPEGFSAKAEAGQGTPLAPYLGRRVGVQALGVSAALLEQGGFIPPEATTQAEALGELLDRGTAARQQHLGQKAGSRSRLDGFYITGGLNAHRAGPVFKSRQAANQEAEPTAQAQPWRTDAEREAFARELSQAGFDLGRKERIDVTRLTRAQRFTLVPALRAALERALDPQDGFLVGEGWLESIASVLPTFRGEVVPWFNYAIISLLQERVRPEWQVFEFGCGFSTLWWSTHVRHIVAVENAAEWMEAIRPLLDPDRATLLHREAAAFPTALDAAEGNFDVIVVDGAERPACARAALPRLKPDGVLLFDNTHRREYAEAIAEIESAGFRQLRLTAPAPTTVRAETTSLFYRPGNCFGL